MLTEDEVVQSVRKYLDKTGYRVDKICSTSEQGIDIEAVNIKTGRPLFVEAKGGTSSKPDTKRFGLSFTRNQAKTHIAVALYWAAKQRQKHGTEAAEIALAFPDDGLHPELVDEISKSIRNIGIIVYFVDAGQNVRTL